MTEQRSAREERPGPRDRWRILARVFAPLFRVRRRRERSRRRAVVAVGSWALVVGLVWVWVEGQRPGESARASRQQGATNGDEVFAVHGRDPRADGIGRLSSRAALVLDAGTEEGQRVVVRVRRRVDGPGSEFGRVFASKVARTRRISLDDLPVGDVHVVLLIDRGDRTEWREVEVHDLVMGERRVVEVPTSTRRGRLSIRVEFVDEDGDPLTTEKLFDLEGRYGVPATPSNLRANGFAGGVHGFRSPFSGTSFTLGVSSLEPVFTHHFDGIPIGRYHFRLDRPPLAEEFAWADIDGNHFEVVLTDDEPEVQVELRREARSGPGFGPFVVFALPDGAELDRNTAHVAVSSAAGGGGGSTIWTRHARELGGPYLWIGPRHLGEEVWYTAVLQTDEGTRLFYRGVTRDRTFDDEPLSTDPIETVSVRLVHSGVARAAGAHRIELIPPGPWAGSVSFDLDFQPVVRGQARLISAPIDLPPGWEVRASGSALTWRVPTQAEPGAVVLAVP